MIAALRGATTVDSDCKQEVLQRTIELLRALHEKNNIVLDDVAAIVFSATPDIKSAFPAAAARQIGWESIPLFGAQELEVEDAPELCIRVMLLINYRRKPNLQPIYLHGAQRLRPDLIKSEDEAK